MAEHLYLVNTSRKDWCAAVDGKLAVGQYVVSQVYDPDSPLQQWIPAEYPGTDLKDTDGVVCVLFTAQTLDGNHLALTAWDSEQPVTVEKFVEYNPFQLWGYPGTGSEGIFVNLGNASVLDLRDGEIGDYLQTWPRWAGSLNQEWELELVPPAGAEPDARSADETLAAV